MSLHIVVVVIVTFLYVTYAFGIQPTGRIPSPSRHYHSFLAIWDNGVVCLYGIKHEDSYVRRIRIYSYTKRMRGGTLQFTP